MATKDERPEPLFRAAMFVPKSPVGVAQPASAMASAVTAYDHPASRTLLECQRQNDLTRNREFDALRRLRNRSPGDPGLAAGTAAMQAHTGTGLSDS
jgi:hypothetical protein